ncbi:MAG: CPBP family intramembrane metalloprotease [Spirochaetales bacterium]|nr:CPBP family intramembrane metalloprotease [Spirochaetales bacterium]
MFEKIKRNKLVTFFIYSYLLFWVGIAFIGLLVFLGVPVLVQDIMKNVVAWTPTFVVLIMFKSLYPNVKFKDYLKNNFLCKIKPQSFIISLLIQVFVLIIVVLMFLFLSGTKFSSLEFIALQSIIPVFLINLTSGPIGEELGWRGYALNKLQKKYSPLIASIILGLFWGFWHLPLWVLSGYTGLQLFYYIITFLVAVTSLSVFTTYFYNKSKNILIAMWIHFWFNFLLRIVIIDLLTLLIYMSLVYLIITLLLIFFKRKELL